MSQIQDVFIMRFWHEPSSEPVWRVTLTDTRTQEKFYFARMESLLRFFADKLEGLETFEAGE